MLRRIHMECLVLQAWASQKELSTTGNPEPPEAVATLGGCTVRRRQARVTHSASREPRGPSPWRQRWPRCSSHGVWTRTATRYRRRPTSSARRLAPGRTASRRHGEYVPPGAASRTCVSTTSDGKRQSVQRGRRAPAPRPDSARWAERPTRLASVGRSPRRHAGGRAVAILVALAQRWVALAGRQNRPQADPTRPSEPRHGSAGHARRVSVGGVFAGVTEGGVGRGERI